MTTKKSFAELYVEAYESLLKPTPSVLLGGGFQTTDKMLGGFRPREFTILCGATGSGKTTLLANWSAQFLQSKTPHFVASVETGYVDFIRRVASAMSWEDLNTGEVVSVEKLRKFHNTYGEILNSSNATLSLYENRFSVETLMDEIKHEVDVNGCKIAMIDNLNFFLEVTSAQDSLVEMDRVIHELIIFCKQVDVHVVMVMHPKKTDNGRVDSEFDIKGSSTAVQEAHNILLFNRPSKDLLEKCSPSDREITFKKMRRRGKYVGNRLILQSKNGVTYAEGDVYEPKFY